MKIETFWEKIEESGSKPFEFFYILNNYCFEEYTEEYSSGKLILILLWIISEYLCNLERVKDIYEHPSKVCLASSILSEISLKLKQFNYMTKE